MTAGFTPVPRRRNCSHGRAIPVNSCAIAMAVGGSQPNGRPMPNLDELHRKFWPPVTELGVMPETVEAVLTKMLGRPPTKAEFDAVLQQSIDRKTPKEQNADVQ